MCVALDWVIRRLVLDAVDPVRAMFFCPKFEMERRNLDQWLDRNVSPRDIVAEMLRSKES